MALSESNSEISVSQTFAPKRGHWQLYDPQQCLSYLYDVIVKSHCLESYNQAMTLLLEAGKQRFGMENALVSRPVSESVYEVLAFSGEQPDRFYVGQHISTSENLCHRISNDGEVNDVPNLCEQGWMVSPLAYGGMAINTYLGTKVNSQLTSSGVVCFFSSEPRAQDVGEEDRQLLSQLADGIAYLVDQQKSLAQRKNIDTTMYATGSISTLDEYIEQGKLPELYGIPGRVVEVLKRRIGESGLSIGHVADDLNLSKRTLQRRLQQQSVNFAELRDQVRYHYSIDYLVKNRQSIDGISAALDFSDRTSFTNAFKRWTGMSPSTFRKLFRDYV